MGIDDIEKIEDNVEHLRERVEKIKTGMLTTFSASDGFHSRPMGTAEVDEFGNIWFFTNEFSEKAQEISVDNKVILTYADPNVNTYLSVSGKAYLVEDKPKMEKLWNPFIKAFFPDGLDDPKLTLLKVESEQMEYWVSPTNTIVVMLKIAKAAMLGEHYTGDHDKVGLKV